MRKSTVEKSIMERLGKTEYNLGTYWIEVGDYSNYYKSNVADISVLGYVRGYTGGLKWTTRCNHNLTIL